MEWAIIGVLLALVALVGYVLLFKRTAPVVVETAEPRIAAAVMTAAASKDKPLAAAIETAMGEAVMKVLASGVGIDQTDAIRSAMLDARARVLRAAKRR